MVNTALKGTYLVGTTPTARQVTFQSYVGRQDGGHRQGGKREEKKIKISIPNRWR